MEKISKETNIKKKLFTHEKFLILCSYQFGGVPEWPKGSDCKSDGTAFEGSNPSPSTILFLIFPLTLDLQIMKVISFNINGIRARLHQLEALIKKHEPDVIGLQEIKVHNDSFPVEAIEKMGYYPDFNGQKAHYGVAFLSKKKPVKSIHSFPSDDGNEQKRIIIHTYDYNGKEITIINGYFPQGENIKHETKFPLKRKFYADLNNYLERYHTASDNLIVMGDINISPTNLDIGIGEPNAKRWLRTGKTSFQPEEREWLAKLQSWGLHDSFREKYPNVDDKFSWFDYRSKGFLDNRGLRIDVLFVTKSMLNILNDSGIDYEIRGIEKPSDHAPVWSTFKL